MFYVRLLAILVWLALCCCWGLLRSLVRWKDPELNTGFARLLGRGALRLSGISVALEGAHHLRDPQPCIFVANHQGNFDLLSFGSNYPARTLVIGKKEIRWIPFFGWFFVAAGNILIDRGNRAHSVAGLGEAVKAIRQRGCSIWIFPEGTRNRTKESFLPFKRGAFHMAVAAQAPIVPLVCSPLRPALDAVKRGKRATLQIRALDPVPTAGLTEADVPALISRVRSSMEVAFHGLSTTSVESRRP